MTINKKNLDQLISKAYDSYKKKDLLNADNASDDILPAKNVSTTL